MKKVVVLTGSGVSAESGLKTFREAGGLWEGHDVTQVASPQGWTQDRKMVLDFYNERRKQALDAQPNEGHRALTRLEDDFDVVIITQNVDNLHERAGSSHVIHLHGELFKSRSTLDPSLVYDIEGWELNEGDKCEKGSQLRPHIVWFGEQVPMMDLAVKHTVEADLFMVIGTSLVVYPAAGLLDFVASEIPKFIIDPNIPYKTGVNLFLYEEPASIGVPKAVDQLLADQ
ncbi:cobB [Symbiodinium microadriaticum]|nr:cobB [Symbiodinium microadriaticum]